MIENTLKSLNYHQNRSCHKVLKWNLEAAPVWILLLKALQNQRNSWNIIKIQKIFWNSVFFKKFLHIIWVWKCHQNGTVAWYRKVSKWIYLPRVHDLYFLWMNFVQYDGLFLDSWPQQIALPRQNAITPTFFLFLSIFYVKY